MDDRDVQDCYYCGKPCYAVDDESYVVCNKCWKEKGHDQNNHR